MSFRAWILIISVFLCVLRLCSVEDPQTQRNATPSSQLLSKPSNNDEHNVIISSDEKSASSESASSSHSSSLSSPSTLLVSLSSSSSSTTSTSLSSSTESVSDVSSSSSSDLGISTSELEQLVLPTVAPATPHFDTDTVTSSLSVVTSVTEAISQDMANKEQSKPIPVLVSKFERKDLKNEEPIPVEYSITVEKQEKSVNEEEKREEVVPESVQENKGEDKILVTPLGTEEKKIEVKKIEENEIEEKNVKEKEMKQEEKKVEDKKDEDRKEIEERKKEEKEKDKKEEEKKNEDKKEEDKKEEDKKEKEKEEKEEEDKKENEKKEDKKEKVKKEEEKIIEDKKEDNKEEEKEVEEKKEKEKKEKEKEGEEKKEKEKKIGERKVERNKEEEKKEKKKETTLSPPTEDKDEDSITAGLKQAEQETKSTSEEMPSFDEFKRQLQQEEEKQKSKLKKQKEETTSPTGTHTKPKPKKIKERKQNNYASMDCGAKILAANPEASNIFSILQDNRDIYMLNPCTAKIWFIVELCDTAQVRRIDIANFELFSSTPESFRVYVSGRYPTRDWTLLGTFQARDERTLQSFPLEEPIYAKYFKVEMLSHFGKEHYCPLSLFRVYGTSMMEELEDHEAGGQEDSDSPDQDDELVQVLPSDPSAKSEDKSNILATVGDTLMNMVKNAAKKLTGVIKDNEPNATGNDVIISSTVAPTTVIVSSTVSKQQQGSKQSIVTLIPSEDEDENLIESKVNKTTNSNDTVNVTNATDAKAEEQPGAKPKDGNTNFYGKVDSDNGKGSKTTASFSSCQILVRMLGHSGFGCFMGKVLYSKRKHGITPREDAPKKSKNNYKDKLMANVNVGKANAKTEKEKEESKKAEEKEKDEKEEKVDEKEKKRKGKTQHDEKPVEKATEKLKESDSENMRVVDKQTKSTLDESNQEKSKEIQSTPSVDEKAIDPSSLVQPSQSDPLKQPLDSNTKGTPSLDTVSSLTTQPSQGTLESTSTTSTTPDSKPSLDQVKKSPDELPQSQSSVQNEETKIEDEQSSAKTKEGVISTESESTTKRVEVVQGSLSSSSVEDSSLESKGSCTSAQASDHSLVNPTQLEKPSKCVAPSVIPNLKDVDVLEFKLLDSTGREGTAHPEKAVEPEKLDKPVKPDEPEKLDKLAKPDQPEKSDNTSQKEDNQENELTKDKEKEKSGSAPQDNQPVGGGSLPDIAKAEDSSASAKSSVSEPSKPDVVAVPSTSVVQPAEPPTVSPPVETPEKDSVNPLPAPPVITDTSRDMSSSIEASLVDDVSKSSSSTSIGQMQGSSGAQKESIFMRLTNRIKALEQNLTLSTLYMEKLNQKYRQIVEEMQKSFDKKINLLTNATIKAENVIKNQKEQIAQLQSKVDETREDMKLYNKKLSNLNKEVMERHIIGLFLEVIFIIILFIVFRRWDKARFKRDVLRDSLTNGSIKTSQGFNHPTQERSNLSKMLNGQLSAREQLQRSFSTPVMLPENVGAVNGNGSVVLRHKEDYYPSIDAKKKRNRRRPKSAILSTETSQLNKHSTELANESSQCSVVSTTAGLLFNPARGIINGLSDGLLFTRSQSLDDTNIQRKLSAGSKEKLLKSKSLNVIHENSEQNVSNLTSNYKKGRIPPPPPPPPGLTNGMNQRKLPGQLPSSIVLTQRKGQGLNGHHPIA